MSSSIANASSRLRRLAKRKARRDLTTINPSNSHPQTQSPLWSKLPPELRNQIFDLAVSQHLDPTEPYPENSYRYRPGYTHAFRVCTSLLLTCRLAYWETNTIPLRSSTLTVWHDYRPPRHKWPFADLTAKNAQELRYVHLFTPVSWLEDTSSLAHYTRLCTFRPETLTLTIRHSDWRQWERDHQLRIDDAWVYAFEPPPSLRQIVIEFETLERKKRQLDDVMREAVNWRFKGADGRVFSAGSVPPKFSRWTGRADLDGTKWDVHYRQPNETDTVDYYIVTLTWRPVEEEAGSGEVGEVS